MNVLKKGLAVLALVSMVIFAVSVVVLLVSGGMETHSSWIYLSMSAFLFFGVAALVTDHLIKNAEKRKQEAVSEK